MPSPSIFPPIPLRIEHKANPGAGAALLAEIANITGPARRQVESAFGEISQIVDRSLSGFKQGNFSTTFDISGLRQAANDATFAAERLKTVRDATTALAAKTNDTSDATKIYIRALEAQTLVAERNKAITEAQVQTYTRLQGAVDRAVQDNERLAASYRATFIEQAKSENVAFASQNAINRRVSPTLSGGAGIGALGSRAIDNGAGYAALAGLVEKETAAEKRNAAAAAEAAKAQQLLAEETLNLRRALDPTLAIQERFDAEMIRAEKAFRGGAIGAREYAAAQALARQNIGEAYDKIVQSGEGLGKSTSRLGTGFKALSVGQFELLHVVRASSDSFAAGLPVQTIFAEQLGRISEAAVFLGADGTLGKLGKFLGSGWGLALTAGLALLTPFIAKLLEGGDAVEKETRKLAENATQTEITRRAKERFGKTTEGVTAAILDQEEALKQQVKALVSAAEQSLNAAHLELGRELQIRATTQALLEQALANEKVLNSGPRIGSQRGENSDFRNPTAESERLEKAIAANAALITKARANVIGAQSFADIERGKTDADPAAKIRQQYEGANGLIEQARKRAIAENKVGDALERQVANLKRAEQAALDALKLDRARQKAAQETAVFGSPLASGSFRQTSGFGVDRGNHSHAGLDLATAVGSAVYAAQAGIIKFAGQAGGYGNLIDINHGGGTSTRYGHLSELDVVNGQAVAKGDVIGRSGGARGAAGAGDSTGPHLHYEVRVNGKPVDPSKGAFPVDGGKVAEDAAKAADALKQFGQSSADAISRVNDRFNEQPNIVDQSRAAVQKLDEVIAELEKRKPPNFKALIEQAKAAQDLARAFADTAIDKFVKQSERGLQIQILTNTGREREAAILTAITNEQQSLSGLSKEQVDRIGQQAAREYDVNEALKKRVDLQNIYLDATRSVRSEVEAILSGTGKISNLGATFRQLQGKILTERLFGDAFRDLDKFIKQNTGIQDSTDKLVHETGRAGDAASTFADALAAATSIVNGAASSTSLSALRSNGAGLTDLNSSVNNTLSAASILGGGQRAANDNGSATGDEIVVNGRPRASAAAISPDFIAGRVGTIIVGGFTDALRNVGIKLSPQASGVLAGGVSGFLTAGPAGGVIGALKAIPGLPDGISKGLGKVLGGLQTSQAVTGLADAVGIHLNKTGSKIGGALGSLVGGPIGGIIGSIAGGIIGNLFSSAKTGSAALGRNAYGTAGVIGTGGNNAAATASANGLGGQVGNQINQIADALGAKVGTFAVAIGQRNDQYRVSGSGSQSNTTSKHTGSDVIYNGKDPQAAIAAAVQNAIQDGAISGISAASKKILQSGQDLNVAIQKAVAIENIPKALKQLTDPVGAAVDALNQQFSKLISYLQEGGATAEQYTQAQKLYDLQRATAIKQAATQLTSSLQGLYDSLTVGNSALSLKDRKDAALAKFTPLETRVNAGDTTAYGDFATAATTLLDIERQLSGSQTGYFDLATRIAGESKGQIDLQQKLADAATASDSPFNAAGVVTAINGQTADLTAYLKAINDNIASGFGGLLAGGGGGGGNYLNTIRSTSYF